MANPTVKPTFPLSSALIAALWVSDQIDQGGTPSKGAWDAVTGTFYPAYNPGAFSGVQVGAGIRNALRSTLAVCGIELDSADDLTTGAINELGSELCIAALVRKQSTAAARAIIFQNEAYYTPPAPGGIRMYTVDTATASAGEGTSLPANTNTSKTSGYPAGEWMLLVYRRGSDGVCKLYRNDVSNHDTGTANTSPRVHPANLYSRRAGLFNYKQSLASSISLNAQPQDIAAVFVFRDGDITVSDIQAMGGTSSAGVLVDPNAVLNAAFDFADTDTTAPTITGPTGVAGDASISITIAENTTDLGVWTSNESATWGVTGVDAAKVTIGSGTGAGLLIASPNFENPQDVGNDNVLNFNITATDAALNVRSQAVVLTVINSNESPVFVGPSIGLVSGVAGSAITPTNLALRWTDPDTGDTGTYTKTGTWPAGPDLTTNGVLQGTIPAVDGVYSGATVTRTDGNGVAAVSNAFNFEATPIPPTYYSATWGGFALNTGSGKRAPGTVFNWWAFHNAVIGDNPAGLTVASGSGVLNGAGEAVVATFPLPGTWEVQTRFPNDAGDATQKGTARTTVTAA